MQTVRFQPTSIKEEVLNSLEYFTKGRPYKSNISAVLFSPFLSVPKMLKLLLQKRRITTFILTVKSFECLSQTIYFIF